MTEENGYLVEYEHEYSAKLDASNTIKNGWRVFNKDMTLQGVLDFEKLAIWYVDESTLTLIK